MVKHIFIATIKDGVSNELLNKQIEEMRGLKDSIPEIENIIVEKNTGWVGMANAVTMIIDLKDKEAFDALIQSPARLKVSKKADETFDTSNIIISQIEY